MGEDFVAQILSMKKGKNPKWEEAKKYIRDNRKAITKKWNENMNDDTEHDVVKRLIDDIDTLKRGWDDGSRECITFEHKGDKILITGGLSWGDNPTETFGAISDLDESGILDLLGFE